MNTDFSPLEELIQKAETRLTGTVQAVLKRGYDEVCDEYDDYSILISQFEFKKLIIFQLYESYCLPQRHEFELQIITDIVEAVAQSGTAAFLGTAALSGVVGSAAFEVSKRLIALVAKIFESDKVRSKAFREIEANLVLIRNYFKARKQASIEEISTAVGVDSNKIEPLLKLLGFKYRRRKKRQVWIRPQDW